MSIWMFYDFYVTCLERHEAATNIFQLGVQQFPELQPRGHLDNDRDPAAVQNLYQVWSFSASAPQSKKQQMNGQQ